MGALDLLELLLGFVPWPVALALTLAGIIWASIEKHKRDQRDADIDAMLKAMRAGDDQANHHTTRSSEGHRAER